MNFRSVAICCGLVVAVLVPVGPSVQAVTQEDSVWVQPSQWPSSRRTSALFQGWPNAIRIFGPDRYQTGLAVSFALRGTGGFPFSDPDHTSGGAEILGDAGDWWGLATCPRAVILVAGDSPADALSASALSDSTGLAKEPYLQRVASADPLFDPIGGFDRVDTYRAPILSTSSARSGASKISGPTKIALRDLRSGGCRTARQVVIVGGTKAISEDTEDELLALGYQSVFRVHGADRYETAALVAQALGTSSVPNGVATCADPDSSDGTSQPRFYANSVVEFRQSSDSCELLSRTVVLADGVTGADALAAGWWTSFWQVPVFLHDGSELLPDATVEGLQTMDVSNIIVLGGESRIPRSAVVDAVQVTGAATVRIEGTDRYATSVAMARHFGGWWPTDRAFDASGSLFCVAASSGEGGRAVGWSDALGAGPLCGAMTADERGAPVRLMGAVNSSVPIESSEVDNRSRSAVPIILLPPGNADWPKPVSDFFEDMFPPGDAWCDGEPTGGGCAEPAFAVGFGGPATLSQQSMERVSRVSGGHRNHVVPESTGEPPFLTSLSMAPSFHQNDRNVMKICHLRGSYQGARWLTAGVNGTERPKSFEDVSDTGWYLMDERGYSQNNRNGTPGCVGLELIAGENAVWARNLGPQGQIVQSWVSDVGPASRVVLDGLLTARSARTMSGVDSAATGPELSLTTLTFGSPTPGVQIDVKGRKMAVTAWDLILNLRRGSPTRTEPPHTFEATMLVQGDGFGLSGDATGEAVYSAGTWFLRGRAEFQLEADSIRLSGGFSLDLFVGDPMILDDRVSWRFDGFG